MFVTYRIATRTCQDILLVRLEGLVNRDTADAMAAEVIALILQHDPRCVVVDMRPLQGRLSTADTFFHVRTYPRDMARYQTAIVDREEHRAYCEFYELTARNLGHNIRCFHDPDEALHWLGAHSGLLAASH